MDIRQRLAANLRRARQQKGWSQEQLAFEADIHRTYISDLERGSRNPTISVVDRLAKALKTSLGELLD
ncbi:MAG: helix-turn-helix transcriptional regulator [Rhizobiaceae bacterium]